MPLHEMLTTLFRDGLTEEDPVYAMLDKLQVAVERAHEHGIVLRVEVGFQLPRRSK